MARKSKKKQEEEFVEGVLGLSGIGAGIGAYWLTEDATISGIVAALGIAIAIVMLVMRKTAQQNRLRMSGIAQIDKMTGTQFEEYLGLLFRQLGYDSRVTQASGDFGADVVLKKNGHMIVVQAKRYKTNVSVEAVQQVYAAAAHYKATGGAWVVTNSDYTPAAYQLAKSTKVRLINREQLIELILRTKQTKKSATNK
ncbi:restriction endonuclease [Paenibacillus bovis]|uniref:Restriction endonuclease type IV Mrr domain-containing protein n=1 Tax=Paenibacillus bovis TaxID=1616788 RepID=A0A1X9T4A8_9BACL|nr:restriction endonuclease [Paenibacillus bovis]ARR10763.1 hypothetical protein AR543_p0155 [Paenibacillus bovis]